MINHLQEARQAKGYDSPSYLKRLKMDKVRAKIQEMGECNDFSAPFCPSSQKPVWAGPGASFRKRV